MLAPPVEVLTRRLRLLLPDEDRAPEVLRYFADNRDHLERWAPVPPDDFYTLGYWRRRLRRGWQELEEDRSLRLYIYYMDQPGRVIGTAGFTDIVRGVLQQCNLGYGLAAAEQGKGVMTEALAGAIPVVFEELALHRIAAGYIPSNERSGAVLKRLGFSVEGYARDYLFIGGRWRDHILTALVNPDPKPPKLPRRTGNP
jgi:[ribosomal protein S5]-alanine N-acetyltransferase